MLGGIAQDVELHVEQLLELEAHLRALHVVEALRVVNLAESIFARHEVKAACHRREQRLGDGPRRDAGHEGLGEFLDGARGHAHVFHLLRGDVTGLHAHLGQLHVGGFLHVGVGKLVAPLKHRGLAEDDELLAHLVILVNIFGAIEPHEVDDAVAVGEMPDDALLAGPHGKLLEAQNAALDLHKRHVTREFVDAVYPRAVHIFIRIILQQVAPRLDVELAAQNLFPAWAHAGEVHDVLV